MTNSCLFYSLFIIVGIIINIIIIIYVIKRLKNDIKYYKNKYDKLLTEYVNKSLNSTLY